MKLNINYEEYNLSSKAVLVLHTLMEYVNHKTGECWPSLKSLASKSRLSVSTVQRALRELLAAGLLKKKARYRQDGSQTSNIYVIITDIKKQNEQASENLVLMQQHRDYYLRTRSEAAARRSMRCMCSMGDEHDKASRCIGSVRRVLKAFKLRYLTTPPIKFA